MDILKDIPVQTGVTHRVDRITLNLPEKLAYVQIDIVGVGSKTIVVDILQLFTDYSVTSTQKTTIRSFVKYIIAEAVEVAQETITEEIFSES